MALYSHMNSRMKNTSANTFNTSSVLLKQNVKTRRGQPVTEWTDIYAPEAPIMALNDWNPKPRCTFHP